MNTEHQTPLMEAWARELARQMLEPRGEDTPDSVLLRVAVALVQARAKEARHISGTLMIAATNPHNTNAAHDKALAFHLGDRSQKLEEFAIEMAGQSKKATIELPAGPSIN